MLNSIFRHLTQPIAKRSQKEKRKPPETRGLRFGICYQAYLPKNFYLELYQSNLFTPAKDFSIAHIKSILANPELCKDIQLEVCDLDKEMTHHFIGYNKGVRKAGALLVMPNHDYSSAHFKSIEAFAKEKKLSIGFYKLTADSQCIKIKRSQQEIYFLNPQHIKAGRPIYVPTKAVENMQNSASLQQTLRK